MNSENARKQITALFEKAQKDGDTFLAFFEPKENASDKDNRYLSLYWANISNANIVEMLLQLMVEFKVSFQTLLKNIALNHNDPRMAPLIEELSSEDFDVDFSSP